jgi:o-succinylbenzoate synthase
MNVTRFEAVAWDVPMRAPYRSAQRITTTAHNVLVTVTLEDGTTGYGESAPATYVTGETQESVVQAVNDFAGRHRGTDTGELLESVRGLLKSSPGAGGAIEMAMLDALAQQQGVPLYRYLGATADAIPERLTDLSLPILPPDEAATRAAAAYAEGFRAFKIKVGGGDAGEDTARVRAVAEAGPEATLRLDGNQGFTSAEAVAFAEGLSDLAARIEMFEQPTKAGDADAMRAVQAAVPYPVFADESAHDAEDARRLLENGVCRGVVLKLAKSGLSGAQQIAHAARDTGGACLFGCMMETRLAIGAALHLAIALGPEVVPFLDLDGHLLVNDTEMLSGGFLAAGPRLTADPDRPGIGIAL